MSARAKLNSALQSINDAERVMKRIRIASDDANIQYQLRKALRELDEAKQYIERARREASDLS
jgi:DNA mismatch repair ATPase MutS